jgi:hypothetical protein
MDKLERNYRWVREEDPDHPCWIVLYQMDLLRHYDQTTDALGSDPYPIPTESTSRAGRWTEATVSAVEGARPVWQVPQAFNWACYHPDQAEKYRLSTYEEMRSMAFQCVLAGARGLIWYSFFDLKKEAATFEARGPELCRVNEQIRQLVPVFLSVEAPPPAEAEIPQDVQQLRWAVYAHDGKAYLVAAAASETTGEATFRVAGATAAREIFENRAVPLTDGVLRQRFAPNEVVAFEIELAR